MKPWLWLVVAILGLSLMIGAYRSRFQPDPHSPWAHGFLVFEPETKAKGPGTTVEKRPPGLVVPARVRLLPGTSRAELMLKVLSSQPAGKSPNLAGQLRPKLIEVAA